jgi:hypothetical protein
MQSFYVIEEHIDCKQCRENPLHLMIKLLQTGFLKLCFLVFLQCLQKLVWVLRYWMEKVYECSMMHDVLCRKMIFFYEYRMMQDMFMQKDDYFCYLQRTLRYTAVTDFISFKSRDLVLSIGSLKRSPKVDSRKVMFANEFPLSPLKI